MSNLTNNTTSLQEILETINNLPDTSSGVELPELSNEGASTDLMSGKELIDSEGNVVTGTFTIDNELTTQDSLIAQIQTALKGKAGGSGGGGTSLNITNVSVSTFRYILATTYVDGVIGANWYTFMNCDGNISNVLSGSALYVQGPTSGMAPTVSGATLLNEWYMSSDEGTSVVLCAYQVD